MNNNLYKYFITVILLYLIFLWDFDLTYTNKNTSYNIVYKGLLWVVLDNYSIQKYNSDDKPMQMFKYSERSI